MLACVLPHKRRYSASLLAMTVMWLKISPTASRHNYQEGNFEIGQRTKDANGMPIKR